MKSEQRDKALSVILRGLLLVGVLNLTATDFDGTEMVALLLFLSGDSVISALKGFFRK